MQYDIAAKVLIEKCRGEILRRLLGLSVSESSILEQLPQETVSVKRSDFPILVTDETGKQYLVLLEIQSRWERKFPLRLLDYRCRHLLKHDMEAISCVLLLKPSQWAESFYKDPEVEFNYRLIKVYELDACEIIKGNIICLMPFVPIMKNGKEMVEQADAALYESPLPYEDKADMLTVMTIFSGLVSEKLVNMLISKRRDIMIESAAYDIIKEEGIKEGIKEGREKGIREGREKGIKEGKAEESQDGILDILEIRFNVVPESVIKSIRAVDDPDILRTLRRQSLKVSNLIEFKELLKKSKE
jgi:predicted transposase YdaD